MKYICTYGNQCSESYNTLQEAFEDYENCHGVDNFTDLTFYKVEEVIVEQKIVEIVTVQKAGR
jgi:hypothetical protein